MTERSKLLRVSKCASWLVVAAGVAIILGWQFRIPVLKGQAFGTFVAPATALNFLLCGASVLLQLSKKNFLQRIGMALAMFVTVFAIATGVEYLFSIDLHIDTLFMAHRMSDWTLPLPGRYTTNSVFGFFCAGLSLLTMRRRPGLFSELFAIFALLVAYLSIVAFMFGASSLYDHVMAVHTAVLFGVLAIALLTGIWHPVLISTLTGPFAGAIASRKMILAVIFLLPVFGGAELFAERMGIVSLQLGSALSVIASVVVFTFLALRTAIVLNETDRKRLEGEAALLKSTQLAAAGRMAASIAHEVNNPLESITNLIFLLKNDGLSLEERKTYLSIAERELTRVAAIARRTLGFYREDSKESIVDVRELVESVLDVYHDKLAAIHVELAFGDPARIRVRAGEIRQVLTNLIANAIDALRPQGGTLRIETRSSQGMATISISDSGTGISTENLKHIYEPFFTTKRDTGTGLGLWVSRELVAKNNGSIVVESQTGVDNHGTRFDLIFPVYGAPAEKQSSGAEAIA